MPDTAHLLMFMLAGVVLNLTPGPDVLFILTHSLQRGWRAGAVAALGITAGCCVHIAAAALGVSALVAASATAFAALKWLGVAYLVYVGWRMLGLGSSRNAAVSIAMSQEDIRSRGQIDLKNIFVQGFWTNALNPKVALFFLAFLPQFIAQDAAHKMLVFFLLGLIFNFNGLWVNLGYAALGAAVASRLTAFQRGMRWLDRVAGGAFVGFGITLALTDNPTQPIEAVAHGG